MSAVGRIAAAHAAGPTGARHLLDGLRQGAHLVVSGNHVVVDTTLRTLHLGLLTTAVAAVLGVPAGCALGLGRSRSARACRLLVNVLVRVPPVLGGLGVLLVLTESSPYGGGPLAGLHWYASDASAYLAQTLLAVPLVIALTAVAVQAVEPTLLDQARAFGATRRRVGALAVREARRRVLAVLLITLGVTMTSIGAIAVADAPAATKVGGTSEPPTLALGAFQAITESGGGGSDATSASEGVDLGRPTPALAVAFATVLLGLFVLIAAVLTWLQQTRIRWVPGLPS